ALADAQRSHGDLTEQSHALPGRAARDLIGPQLAADADRPGGLAAAALSGRAVTVPERRRVQPRLEAGVVPPPGHHQPGGAPVGRLEELEALEAVLVVDRACPGGEPAGQLVPALGRHGDGIDLHDGHVPIMPAIPGATPPEAQAPAPARTAAG